MTEVCECVYTGAMYTFVYKSIAEERERDGELFLLLLRFIFSSLSLSVTFIFNSTSSFRASIFVLLCTVSFFFFFLGLFFRLFFIVLLFLPKLSMPYIQSNHFGSLFLFRVIKLISHTLLTIVLDRCQIMYVQYTFDSIRLLTSACLISFITITYLTSSIKSK